MKKFVVAAVATAVLGASSAFAADLPTKASGPAMVAAPFNWTGWYIGGNAGGAWGRSDTDSPLANVGVGTSYIASVVADINAQRSQSLTASGFTGGVQAGYNHQAGAWVFGLEADFNSFHLSNSSSVSAYFTGFPGPGAPPTYTNSFTTDWLFTGRARLGYAPNNWLFYATGGVALTNLKYTHTFVEGTFAGSSGGVENSTASATKTGFAVGGGIEYGWSRNWSVKAEYMYLDFGNVTSIASAAPVTGSVFNHTANLRASVARGGINYRF